uniref:Uncharacterized protein n=1 Tax=Trichuris muris TaxID=70415 RepID=A0A5S6QI47_TRIMR
MQCLPKVTTELGDDPMDALVNPQSEATVAFDTLQNLREMVNADFRFSLYVNIDDLCAFLREPMVEEYVYEAAKVISRWLALRSVQVANDLHEIWETQLPARLLRLLSTSVCSPLLLVALEIFKRMCRHCPQCCKALIKLQLCQKINKLGKRVWAEFDTNYVHTNVFYNVLLLCCSITKNLSSSNPTDFFPIVEILKPIGTGRTVSALVMDRASLIIRNLIFRREGDYRIIRVLKRHQLLIFLVNCIRQKEGSSRNHALAVIGKITKNKAWIVLHLLQNGLCKALNDVLESNNRTDISFVLIIFKRIVNFASETTKYLASEKTFLLNVTNVMNEDYSREVKVLILCQLVELVSADIENYLPFICYREIIFHLTNELKRRQPKENRMLLGCLTKITMSYSTRLTDLHSRNMALEIISNQNGVKDALALTANGRNDAMHQMLIRELERRPRKDSVWQHASVIAVQPTNHAYNDQRLIVREMLLQPSRLANQLGRAPRATANY